MNVNPAEMRQKFNERVNSIYVGSKGNRKGSPFCVFIPFISGGDVMFGFKAPANGATIVMPSVSVESVTGELVMSGFVGNQTLKPIQMVPGNSTLDSEIELNPFDEIQISVSGSGTAKNVWITYYCA